MLKKRISYVDLGAGIMLIWMMVFHAMITSFQFELFGLEDVADISLLSERVHATMSKSGRLRPINPMTLFPYLHFFMPWFFYKSGQFFQKRKFQELLKSDSIKLVRPFIVWSIVGYVLYLLFLWLEDAYTWRHAWYGFVGTFFHEGYISLNTPLWFLFTLFWVRTLANIILPAKQGRVSFWIRIAGIVIFGYLVSYMLWHISCSHIPQWIANGAAGLAYFTMGYALHEYETKPWAWIPCAVIYILCCIYGFSIVGMKSNGLVQGTYLMNMPECLSGIIVFNVVCRQISRWLPRISRAFESIGQNAMIIYVTHGLLYISISKILFFYELVSLKSYSLWMMLAAYAIFIPLICYVKLKISVKKND